LDHIKITFLAADEEISKGGDVFVVKKKAYLGHGKRNEQLTDVFCDRAQRRQDQILILWRVKFSAACVHIT
jgi:hypothetical protein